MKSLRSGSHRQKTILYYTLAVVLPGIFLGYLAWRGILNDQALLEKESRKNLDLNSKAYFAAIDTEIVRYVSYRTHDSLVPRTEKQDPAILAWFTKDHDGSTELKFHRLLYLPGESGPVRTRSDQIPDGLETGIKLEFTEQRIPEALIFYNDKILRTTDPAEKLRALVASARLYNKTNQAGRAKALYYEILKGFSGSLLNGQIPVGLMATLEILKINVAFGEKDELKTNSQRYLGLLLHPNCGYVKNQFDMFSKAFGELIPKKDSMIDSLMADLEIQQARTEYMIRLINSPDLISDDRSHLLQTGRTELAYIPVSSPELTGLYVKCTENSGNVSYMVIDFPVFLRSVSENLIPRLDPGSAVNVRIEDSGGKLVISKVIHEEAGYVSFPFPVNFPPWKLLLHEIKPGFMSSLLKAGSGFYLYIFILIVILMVLGFIFTIYTLNGELRLNRMKSEFISNVSHELKSPLTSIRMMTEMLHQNRVPSEEQKAEYYAAMLAENERLSHLIDNILDFSRMDNERKKYDFTDLNPDELLRNCLESIRQRISDPDFDIRYNCPDRIPFIRADKDALLQVIYNLVDNAIKFSGNSKQIDIDLILQNEELKLSVKDYGIGIPVIDQDKIFERFYRGDEAQRKRIGGSGIGLTIVKKIVEAHKGRIEIESEPGKGSTFTISIPVGSRQSAVGNEKKQVGSHQSSIGNQQ